MEDNKAAPSAPPPLGRRQRRRLVVFHLVRISYVLASFPEPVLARFSTKFADSENSLPQGAFLKGLVGFAHGFSVQKLYGKFKNSPGLLAQGVLDKQQLITSYLALSYSAHLALQ